MPQIERAGKMLSTGNDKEEANVELVDPARFIKVAATEDGELQRSTIIWTQKRSNRKPYMMDGKNRYRPLRR